MKASKQATGNQAAARQYNALRADAAGGANLLAHNQFGQIALPTNASNNQTLTLTINGSPLVITLVSGTVTNPNDVKIGATGTATAINILAFLQNPSKTNSTQIAATAAEQEDLSYLGFSLPDNTTTITVFSLNNSVDAPLTSFAASTTITGGSYTAATLKLYVQPGIFYVGTTRVVFAGGPVGTAFGTPVANPRIDILTIDSSGVLDITAGSESATPSPPTYPFGKVVICEVYNVVGETALYDNDNQQSGHGFIYRDTRPFNSVIYINNNSQIAAGIIEQSNLANAGTVPTGTVVPYAGGSGTPIAGWLFCTGTAVSRSTYATLFTAIGTTYGAGDGSTTFNLPDMRGRIPVGEGTGAGDNGSGTGTPTGTALASRVLGAWGGEQSHQLSQAELPAHTHSYPYDAGAGAAGSGNAVAYAGGQGGSHSTSSIGSDTAHNTMQPFLVLTYIIKT